MIITEEFLMIRHRFWMERIGKAGIWDKAKFRPVAFSVRKRSKTYDGLFYRKWVIVDGKQKLQDSIIIYQQYPDLTEQEIDDTLVHEMIHQYIYQNGIKDSSVHGKVFKEFMGRINKAFPKELNLRVSGGIKERRGEGDTLHKLIIVYHNNGVCHCCKVKPNKKDMFMRRIKEHKDEWKINKYELCESYDRYFDSLTACNRKLHGLRINVEDLVKLCRNMNIKRV